MTTVYEVPIKYNKHECMLDLVDLERKKTTVSSAAGVQLNAVTTTIHQEHRMQFAIVQSGLHKIMQDNFGPNVCWVTDLQTVADFQDLAMNYAGHLYSVLWKDDEPVALFSNSSHAVMFKMLQENQ